MYYLNNTRTITTLLLFLFCLCTLASRTTIAPGARIVTVYAGGDYYEGSTWDPGTGKLYFTIPCQIDLTFTM